MRWLFSDKKGQQPVWAPRFHPAAFRSFCEAAAAGVWTADAGGSAEEFCGFELQRAEAAGGSGAGGGDEWAGDEVGNALSATRPLLWSWIPLRITPLTKCPSPDQVGDARQA